MTPVVLTIAGSDSGGGAGIQADLKTFEALGCFGTSAITAVTAQNTCGVFAVQGLEPQIVVEQIRSVVSDFALAAAKTGMLFSAPIIEAVHAVWMESAKAVPLVVDPVMVSTSGHRLLSADAETALAELLPCASLITPNRPEAAVLLNASSDDLDEVQDAAAELFRRYKVPVLLKGGHVPDKQSGTVTDVFFDGQNMHGISGKYIATRSTHGTGCTLSAAIAAYLAKGMPLLEAIRRGRAYVEGAIANAIPLGNGFGPLYHGWQNAAR